MKHRSDQKGQVLAYSAISMLAFFSLAAVAVDAGRHILVGRETQAVADAMALAGATALARGGTPTDAYQAAIDIAASAVRAQLPDRIAAAMAELIRHRRQLAGLA